jgi:hypothetical protein
MKRLLLFICLATACNAQEAAKSRDFWSFQPPRKVAPPAVQNAAWPLNDVDRFILAAQEQKGI